MNEAQSEFNSGISYLQTMRELMNSFHKAMIEGNKIDAADYAISLFVELEPRMKEEDIEDIEKDYKNIFIFIESKKTNTLEFKKFLFIFFRKLNKFAHNNGLIMNDKDDARQALQNGR